MDQEPLATIPSLLRDLDSFAIIYRIESDRLDPLSPAWPTPPPTATPEPG